MKLKAFNLLPTRLLGRATLLLFAVAVPYLVQAAPHSSALLCQDPFAFKPALTQSPNRAGVGKHLRALFDQTRELKRSELSHARALTLIDRGLGKATELVLRSASGDEVLVSNFDFKRNNSVGLKTFVLSPSERYVILVAHENGSLQDFTLSVYDLEARSFVLRGLNAGLPHVHWLSDTAFVFNAPKEGSKRRTVIFDLRTPAALTPGPWLAILATKDQHTLAVDHAGKRLIAHRETTSGLDLEGSVPNFRPPEGPLVGELGGAAVMVTVKPSGQHEVRRLRPGSSRAEPFLEVSPQFQIDDAYVNKNTLFLEGHAGAARQLFVMSPERTVLASIATPDGCRFSRAEWTIPRERLRLTIESAVRKESFDYDVKSRRFLTDDLTTRLFTLGGLVYRSEVVMARSADGTSIPVRLTSRADLKRDRANPVLLEAYGGFGASYDFYPSFRAENLEFLKRGGILAAPALRGGGEFGAAWHEAGTGVNKARTVEDLIATARALAAQGFTRPERIIAKGASNGGLVVAAAALKSPEVFGLVIAINGVHDLENHMELDPIGGMGWVKEYGRTDLDAIRAQVARHSPVALAGQASRIPAFLIVNGRDDTQVNPAHSMLLKAALDRNPRLAGANVQLLSIKNSGHWLTKPDYQKVIGWRVQTEIWTRIFDHLGWQIEP